MHAQTSVRRRVEQIAAVFLCPDSYSCGVIPAQPVTRDRLTLGDLARELNVRQHVVKHAITAYSIEPMWRVGIIRQWSVEQLPEIRAAVQRCAERRPGGAHA